MNWRIVIPLLVLVGVLAALPRVVQHASRPDAEGRLIWGRSANQWLEEYSDPVEESGALLGGARKALEADRDPQRATRALRLLGPHATPALIAGLSDERANVREAAANALVMLGPQPPEVVDRLASLVANDRVEMVRLAASWALTAQGPQAVEPLLELARQQLLPEDWHWRSRAPPPRRLVEGLLDIPGTWPWICGFFATPQLYGIDSPLPLPASAPAIEAWLTSKPEPDDPFASGRVAPLEGIAARRWLGRSILVSKRRGAGSLATLAALGGPLDEHIDGIAIYLENLDSHTRAHAARALLQRVRDHERFLPRIRERLAADEPNERAQVLYGMAHAPESIDLFERDIQAALQDAEVGVRLAAIQVLAVGARTDDRWRAVLVKRLEGEADAVIEVLRGVRADNQLDFAADDPATEVALSAAFRRAREPVIRAEALTLLGRVPSAVETFQDEVLDSLAMPSPIRERALYVLARAPQLLPRHAERLEGLAIQGPGTWKPWHYGRLVGLAAMAQPDRDAARATLFERIQRTESAQARRATLTALDALGPLTPAQARTCLGWFPLDMPDVNRARIRTLHLVLKALPDDDAAQQGAAEALTRVGANLNAIPEARALAARLAELDPMATQRIEAMILPMLDRMRDAEGEGNHRKEIGAMRQAQRLLYDMGAYLDVR